MKFGRRRGARYVANIVRAGAELLVAGNAVFGKGDIAKTQKNYWEAARGRHAHRA